MLGQGICTTHEVYPRAYAHLLAALHHFECLVEQDFARQRVVNDLDNSVGERETSSVGILLHADSSAESQFDNDTASESIRDVVVPEREVALCI
jgi:hypothetical protein